MRILGKYIHANLWEINPRESVGNKSMEIFGKYIRAKFQEEFPCEPLQRISQHFVFLYLYRMFSLFLVTLPKQTESVYTHIVTTWVRRRLGTRPPLSRYLFIDEKASCHRDTDVQRQRSCKRRDVESWPLSGNAGYIQISIYGRSITAWLGEKRRDRCRI